METIGRVLITFTLIATLVGPSAADWSRSHVFNPSWPPHSRFHTVVYLFTTVAFSLLGLFLNWTESGDRNFNILIAALIPVIFWGSFFIAILFPGTAVEDVKGQLPRVAGLPLNLFNAGLFVVISAAGYLFYRFGIRWSGPCASTQIGLPKLRNLGIVLELVLVLG